MTSDNHTPEGEPVHSSPGHGFWETDGGEAMRRGQEVDQSVAEGIWVKAGQFPLGPTSV